MASDYLLGRIAVGSIGLAVIVCTVAATVLSIDGRPVPEVVGYIGTTGISILGLVLGAGYRQNEKAP